MNKRCNGLALLEVLVALTIASIAVVMTFSSLSSSIDLTFRVSEKISKYQLSQDRELYQERSITKREAEVKYKIVFQYEDLLLVEHKIDETRLDAPTVLEWLYVK